MPSQPCIFVDSSALLCRYLPDRRRRFVLETMDTSNRWVGSALTRTELMLSLHHGLGGQLTSSILDAMNRDLSRFWEIPVDRSCLSLAGEIGVRYGLAINASLHLAAASRVPKPFLFLSFDQQQLPAAIDLGFEIADPD